MPLKVAIVGARRARQGTGPYVARAFQAAGCEVTAVAGTRADSAAEAAQSLGAALGKPCRGYIGLEPMLEQERPDIVALCCPPEARRALLRQCAQAGCHAYAEKPLWLDEDMSPVQCEQEARSLLDAYNDRECVLGLNTQWTSTLTDFTRLYPGTLDSGFQLRRFEMWLSPAEPGSRMLVDSLSHPLSLLHALAGPGEITHLAFDLTGQPMSRCETRFRYRHEKGIADVIITLALHPEQPRPAAYAINGLRVDRHIEPGTYLISFASDSNSIAVEDPLYVHIRRYLRQIEQRQPCDRTAIVDGMRHFQQIIQALPPVFNTAT